jgi:hypothetical protein
LPGYGWTAEELEADRWRESLLSGAVIAEVPAC